MPSAALMPAVVHALGPDWLQPDALLQRFGAWALLAVIVIVFVECGLFVFFLPGDSLLFATGVLVGAGSIGTPLWLTCVLVSVAAFAGNLTGYWIGYVVGPSLFDRPDSKYLKPEYIARTHAFFERYGGGAIVLGRFVPIVRTFITAMAGVGRMPFLAYAAWSALGAVLWAAGLTTLGYFLGSIPFVKNNIEIIAIVVVLVSVLPVIVHAVRSGARRRDEPTAPAAPVAPPTASE